MKVADFAQAGQTVSRDDVQYEAMHPVLPFLGCLDFLVFFLARNSLPYSVLSTQEKITYAENFVRGGGGNQQLPEIPVVQIALQTDKNYFRIN